MGAMRNIHQGGLNHRVFFSISGEIGSSSLFFGGEIWEEMGRPWGGTKPLNVSWSAPTQSCRANFCSTKRYGKIRQKLKSRYPRMQKFLRSFLFAEVLSGCSWVFKDQKFSEAQGTLDGRNPQQPPEMYKTFLNNGINYQPQLVFYCSLSHYLQGFCTSQVVGQGISEPSTVSQGIYPLKKPGHVQADWIRQPLAVQEVLPETKPQVGREFCGYGGFLKWWVFPQNGWFETWNTHMKMDDFFWGEDPRFKETPIYIYNEHSNK